MKRLDHESATLIDYKAFLLPKLKEILRILDNETDAQFGALLQISLGLIERWTGLTLAERNFTYSYSSPEQSRLKCHEKILPISRTPIFKDSILGLKLNFVDSPSINVDCQIEPMDSYGEVFIGENSNINLADSLIINENFPLTLEYKAGYKEVEGVWACPAELQQAIVSLAAYMYTNPADCDSSGCSCGTSSNGIKVPSETALLIDGFLVKRFDYGMYF